MYWAKVAGMFAHPEDGRQAKVDRLMQAHYRRRNHFDASLQNVRRQ
jgi:hypothetical protein